MTYHLHFRDLPHFQRHLRRCFCFTRIDLNFVIVASRFYVLDLLSEPRLLASWIADNFDCRIIVAILGNYLKLGGFELIATARL